MEDIMGKACGLTRRGFLKTTAALAGVCAFSGSDDVLTALAEEAQPAQSGEQVFVSRCTFGGCTECEREVVVRDGMVVNTRPKADEAFGRRPCLRGYNTVARLYAEDRIKYPMKRVEGTPRGAGEWERISWDEAIQTICEKWREAYDEYGSHSAVMVGGGGGGVSALTVGKLASGMNMVASEASVDNAVKVGLARVLGTPNNPSNKPGHDPWEEDVYKAKTVVSWGANFSHTYTQRWHNLIEAQRNGTRLVCIDPNQTLTADRADNWYRVRPASDVALLNALVQVIIEEGLHDTAFLKEQSAAAALVRKDTGKYLRMSDLTDNLPEGEPDADGNPTYIDSYVVWDPAAESWGSINDVADPQLEGELTVEGVETATAFTLLVDHLADYTPEKVAETVDMTPDEIRELARICADGPVLHIDGLGWQQYDNGVGVGQGLATLMTVTGQLGKPGAGLTPANGAYMMNGIINFQPTSFPGGSKLSIPIFKLPEVAKTHVYNGEELPPFRMMFIWGSSFVGNTVDMNAVTKMIEDTDFVVAVNLTMIDSCQYADIVLPATHPYEREDIVTTAIERIIPHHDKVVDPMFEAKNDFDIVNLLAENLGLSEQFSIGSIEELLTQVLDTPYLVERGITLEALRKNHSMRWHDPGFMWGDTGWTTESKRLELYCEEPKVRIDFGQERNPEFERLPTFKPPAEAWEGTEAMQKYPLVCYTYRSHFQWGFQMHESAWFRELQPDVVVRVNPVDAEARGIADGDFGEVYNDRGHAVARAWYDAGMRPGMVGAPKGYANDQYKAGNFAELMGAYCDPYAVNQSFYDVCVEMRPWVEE